MIRRNWERSRCDLRLELLIEERTRTLPDTALELVLDYTVGTEPCDVI